MHEQDTTQAAAAEQTREEAMTGAFRLAEEAGNRYAALCCAAASTALRDLFPATARLTFEVYERPDGNGWATSGVAVRDAAGELLWHVDNDDDNPFDDDSTVTDRLAAAYAWGIDFFEKVDEPGFETEDGSSPLLLDVDAALAAEAGHTSRVRLYGQLDEELRDEGDLDGARAVVVTGVAAHFTGDELATLSRTAGEAVNGDANLSNLQVTLATRAYRAMDGDN